MCDDRPALNPDEIEVTPEMIEAGVDELLSHDVYPDAHGGGPMRDQWREALAASLRAMLAFRAGRSCGAS